MGKVKVFPYIFFHSLTSIEYYKDILKTKRSFSVKYFVVLSGLATFIITFALSVRAMPVVSSTINTALSEFRSIYPDDLVIKSKDNIWEINKPQPLIIRFPSFGEADTAGLPKNFITFDKEGTLDDVEKYDTMILLNEKNIIVKGSNKLESHPIKDLPDGEFTKASLTKALDNLSKYTGFIQFLFLLILGAGVAFYSYVLRLGYIFFVGGVLWLFCKVAGTAFKYIDVFRIALHTMTLPLMLELAIISSGIDFNLSSWVWFFGTNLIYSVAVVLALTKSGHHLKKD